MGLHLGRQLQHGKNGIVIANSIFVRLVMHEKHGIRIITDNLDSAGFPNIERLEDWLPKNLTKFTTDKDKKLLNQLLNHPDKYIDFTKL